MDFSHSLSFDNLEGIDFPLRRDVRTRDRTAGRKEPIFANAKSWDFDFVDPRRNFLVLKGDNVVCGAVPTITSQVVVTRQRFVPQSSKHV